MQPEAPTRIRHRPIDRDYWIDHCEGYRVEGRGGRIGLVEEVRPDGLLAVRAGLLGRRVLIFDRADVAEIVPRAKRIYLDSSAVPVASEHAE
ncbi:MAG: hypothetical protein WD981_02615 [Gaiellaceae bacterium]